MRFPNRLFFVFSCLLIVCFCLPACNYDSKKEKKGKVIITDSEYSIRQTHENSYVLDVKGKVKNIGDVGVKTVVVTGYCRSCILEFTSRRWFTSDCDKTPNQKDVITYLSAGAEKSFSFEEVAFYFTHEKVQPEDIPEKIEIVVESFGVVE